MTDAVDVEMQNREFGCASHGATSMLHGDGQALHQPVIYEPAGRERHERWPMDERARIVSESFAPGANVSAVARANGVSLGLLHYWRRKARDIGQVEEMRFVPVLVDDAPACGSASGSIEITISDVRIRLQGAVDAVVLRSVLEAVRA